MQVQVTVPLAVAVKVTVAATVAVQVAVAVTITVTVTATTTATVTVFMYSYSYGCSCSLQLLARKYCFPPSNGSRPRARSHKIIQKNDDSCPRAVSLRGRKSRASGSPETRETVSSNEHEHLEWHPTESRYKRVCL